MRGYLTDVKCTKIAVMKLQFFMINIQSGQKNTHIGRNMVFFWICVFILIFFFLAFDYFKCIGKTPLIS